MDDDEEDASVQEQKDFIVHRYFTEFQRIATSSSDDCNSNYVEPFPGSGVLYGGGTVAATSADFSKRERRKFHAKETESRALKKMEEEDDGVDGPGGCQFRTGSRAPVEDLVLLPGPLTEHSLLQTMQAQFFSDKMQLWLGGILLSVNPFGRSPSPEALPAQNKELKALSSLVSSVRNILWDTGVSQVILLNGVTGSGKTYNSHILMRMLFDLVGGGCQTDSFKYLSAALTVIQSFGTAGSADNPHSSRLGYFFENMMYEGAIHRTKIHCYFSDPCRVFSAKGKERNFSVFYQMLSSLTKEELTKYHLNGYNQQNLNYLSFCEPAASEDKLSSRFNAWKACLGVLGVPVSDILRILAATLLLGNVTFDNGETLDLVVNGEKELNNIGSLLGIAPSVLYHGLTQRTKKMGSQIFKTNCDKDLANQAKDNLAAALYSRTLLALIKRANSTRSLKIVTSTASSSSNESFMSADINGRPRSRVSRSSVQGSRNSLSQKPSEFIGILDMLGFEDIHDNGLYQLCINLCAETLQHLYNTHVFKAAEEACIEEGVQCDMDVYYFENAPLVELISSQRTGVLSILEDEGRLQSQSPDAFMHKTRITHKKSPFFEESSTGACFTIKHFAGKVEYNAETFLRSNQQSLPGDLVSVFAKGSCAFGFASHLFSTELKLIQENHGVYKGENFPLMPHSVPLEESQVKTFSTDFHCRLDGLLKTLVQARPHFIRCIKSNADCKKGVFDISCVLKQLRLLQVLETLHITATGFPHRLRYRTFNTRYRVLLRSQNNNNPLHEGMKPFAVSKLILDTFLKLKEGDLPFATAHWALGKKHIFLSEVGHQQLERVRDGIRRKAAVRIQAQWRCYISAVKWPLLKAQLKRTKHDNRHCTPKRHPTRSDAHNSPNLASSRELLNLRPPLPPSRSYTVCGEFKVQFPQKRIMKQNYTDPGNIMLLRDQEITVIGHSSQPGQLLVSYHGAVLHIPHQVTEIKIEDSSASKPSCQLRRALSTPHLQDLC